MPGVGSIRKVGKLKLAGGVVGLLVVLLVGGVALGVLGAPSVDSVDNRFGEVSNETTMVHTDIVVSNPNPIGVQLGETEIAYRIRMNDVLMADGNGTGLDIQRGTSRQAFQTAMVNDQIPSWWVSHVNNDEQTVVTVNATIYASILGEHEFDITQERVVETALIEEFNSEETRPVNADNPPPTTSNPILYVNRTTAAWEQADATTTPIDMQFEMYNPHLEPYVVSEIGYEIRMNEVLVGEGSSEDGYVIPGGATETVATTTIIQNQHLDDWWVTHLQNDQVTDLRIDFSALIELPTGQTLRLPLDTLTYTETIETDIFDNKETSQNSSSPSPEATATPDSTPSDMTTPTTTQTEAATPNPTPTPTPTPTSTESEPIDLEF